MITLREVHSLCVLPRKIPDQAQWGENNHHSPKSRIREQAFDNANILSGDVDFRRNNSVDRHKDEPEGERAGDGEERVLCPDIGNETCFQEHSGEISGVRRGAPCPVACVSAVPLRPIPEDEGLGAKVQDERMVEAVCDPRPEGMHLEEDARLAETIKLRIAIKKAGANKLIEDSEDEGWCSCEEDVVECKGP